MRQDVVARIMNPKLSHSLVRGRIEVLSILNRDIAYNEGMNPEDWRGARYVLCGWNTGRRRFEFFKYNDVTWFDHDFKTLGVPSIKHEILRKILLGESSSFEHQIAWLQRERHFIGQSVNVEYQISAFNKKDIRMGIFIYQDYEEFCLDMHILDIEHSYPQAEPQLYGAPQPEPSVIMP